jgi:3-hydroxyisobutyrate dehydrogenase
MQYGFVGLGNLGRYLAANLARAGFAVQVHDLQRENAQLPLAAGAAWADTLADLAPRCDGLITCLPSPQASISVLQQALPRMRAGSTWIEMSTTDVDTLESLAARASAAGISTLACPVTGGVHKAASAEITILVGGARQAYEVHAPALKAMGAPLVYLGNREQAAVAKVVTNMLAFVHLIAAGEALMLCARAGVALKDAYEAIRHSSGNSFVHETESQLILSGTYDIDFNMNLACKDAGFAVEFGRRYGVPLRLAAEMEQIFIEGRARFGGEAQSTMIVKLLEDAVGLKLRAEGFPDKLHSGITSLGDI